MNMQSINTIVFDLGGVLIDWNPRYLYSKLFENEEEMEYFLTQVCSPTWNAQMDAGKPFAQAIAELCQQHPTYSAHIEAYHTRWAEMLQGTFTETEQALYALTRSGRYRMLALTNWSAETISVAYRKYPLFSCFEGIVVSGDVKLIKPDPAIFQHLMQQYRVMPSETLFIDDAAANIATAKTLGFHTIHFQSGVQLHQKLNTLTLL